MVETARALLDELMGRNRNLDPSMKAKKVNWDDPELFCQYYMVKFCPHDLFVNTRADLGQCPKLHDDEAKRLYESARPGARKRQYEDDFLRFCNNMINEVDRKIEKGKQRLLLMNKGEGGPVYVSKFQEQLNNLNARIKKLLNEAEEAGHRGDVDQAQGLMTLCEQLKEEKETLVSQHDNGQTPQPVQSSASSTTGSTDGKPATTHAVGTAAWAADLSTTQEKQMEVCEVCGAFLIVGDAQQRIEDHLTGKQHLGYSKLRKAVEDMHEQRKKERESEERRREEERKAKYENGMDRRRDRDRERDRDKDRRRIDHEDNRRDHEDNRRRGFSREYDRRDRDNRDRFRDTDRRDRDRDRGRRDRDRDSRRRSRSRSHSHR